MCSACRNHNWGFSSFIFYHRVTRVTRWVPYLEQELLYPSGTPKFTPCFSGIRVARSVVLSIVFCRSLVVLLSLLFGHCIFKPFFLEYFFFLVYHKLKYQYLQHHKRFSTNNFNHHLRLHNHIMLKI